MHLRRHLALAFTVAALLCASLSWGQGQSILLRNVRLVDPATDQNELTVNILLKQGVLDLITGDPVPRSEADVTHNATGGYIIGNLKLGLPANFMILDGDPRTDIDILLDTKTHATFAVRQGVVKLNVYPPVLTDPPNETTARGWLAYSPPPLAVPLDYANTAKWNRWDSKYLSGLLLGGIALDRQYWTDQDGTSVSQVGDLTPHEGGQLRALRLGGVGTINFEKPWIWTVFAATHAFDRGFDSDEDDELSIIDMRLDIPLGQNLALSVGKQREPISMDRLSSMLYVPMQERAAVADAFLPSRNTGIVVSGNLLQKRISLAGGVFNNWLDKDQPNSPGANSTQLVGRATWAALVSDNEDTVLHLGASYRQDNAHETLRARTRPEFFGAPLFIDTGAVDAEASRTAQAEISLRSGPYWIHGEYLQTRVSDSDYGDLRLGGYHVTASWVLSGEMRPYNYRLGLFNAVPIARSVNQNGWGAWELSSRYSHTDASDLGLDGGELDIWSAGLNWWLTPYFTVGVNYRYIELEREGASGHSQGFNTRIALMLE